MRKLCVCALLCMCSATSHATPVQTWQVLNYEEVPNRKLDCELGSTTVTLFDYHVKITAQQRIGDKVVQIMVFPDQQLMRFHVSHVEFGEVRDEREHDLHGPVAKVNGIFVFRESNIGGPRRVHMMVPVQVEPVTEFTVSGDEARVEGNVVIEKRLPHMLSKAD